MSHQQEHSFLLCAKWHAGTPKTNGKKESTAMQKSTTQH